MATVEELMRSNLLEVFGERDPARRAEAIERTYSTEVSFSDPEGSATGHQELDAKARQLLDQAPDFVFSPGGPVRVVRDLGVLEWNFGPAGRPPVVQGVDIALVEDGKIVRLWTMLTSGV